MFSNIAHVTQQGIFWWLMTKMEHFFQIQELSSFTCFLEERGDKTDTNMHSCSHIKLLTKICIHVFGDILNENIANNCE